MKLRLAMLLITSLGAFAVLSACSPVSVNTGGGGGLCKALPASIDVATSLPAGCYTPAGDVAVNAPLTLAPGVTIVFTQDSVMDVNAGGWLNAVGTPASGGEIIFKGASDVKGFWSGINIYSNSTNNDLEYVEVRDTGSVNTGTGSAVWVATAVPFTMEHTVLDYGKGNGLSADASSSAADLTLKANTYDHLDGYPADLPADAIGALDPASVYSNDVKGYVRIWAGEVHTPQTWPLLALPYFVHNGTVQVYAPLAIAAGVTLDFEQYGGISVNATPMGTLSAVGLPTAHITFKGDADQKGYWGNIYFSSNDAGANHLSYVDIRDGGFNTDAELDAYNSGAVSVDNTSFAMSTGEAWCTDGAPSAVVVGTPDTNTYDTATIDVTGTPDCAP